MLVLTAIVSGLPTIATFVGFCFRHVTNLATDFYHKIRVVLQIEVNVVYKSPGK